ncbi:MAG: hypothetical protein HN368_24065 [Spirochaetales bacterium]|jgi:hypothetical protein|nr:hypothetical protein [Spirochaetales bacterium]
MTVTYCDVTGNEIENATTNYAWRIRDLRFDTIRGRDFSVDGLRKLEKAVKDEMEKEDRFNFMEYKRILGEKITAMAE